jgi:hypothetical protein
MLNIFIHVCFVLIDVSRISSNNSDPYAYCQGSPPWLAMTYNLTYELVQFAAYYQVCFVDECVSCIYCVDYR